MLSLRNTRVQAGKGLATLALMAASILAGNQAQALLTEVTVTSPLGLYTEAGSVNSGDAFVTDTWLRTNVRNNGSVGITGDYARSGNGSAYLSGTQGPGGLSSKGDFEYYFGAAFDNPNEFNLGSLSSLSYDWYRDGGSTANSHLHPVLRILVDADGNAATTNDRGYLVYERAYNPSVTPAPTDSWQTDDAISANLWWTQFGAGTDTVYNRDLSDWISGQHSSGFATLSGSSVIYGLSFGFGSGWGPFEGAVDNVVFGLGDSATRWNFELDEPVVPEPATLTLIGAGLAGCGLLRRRRRA